MNDPYLNPLIRTVPETDWGIAVALLGISMFVLSRILFPRYHSRITHAFFNRYEATKLIEEKNVLFNRAGFLLNLIPLLCIAMMVFEQVDLLRPDSLRNHPQLNYLSILALVAGFFGGRLLLIYLFSYSFEQKEIGLRFNQVYLLQFENLGIFILIPSLMLPFTVGIIKFSILVILWVALILWVLYTVIRELEILRSYRISLFYMFLYLCTLEILPLWWVLQSIMEGW